MFKSVGRLTFVTLVIANGIFITPLFSMRKEKGKEKEEQIVQQDLAKSSAEAEIQGLPPIVINIKMPSPEAQAETAAKDGRYGPTKEKTVYKENPLSPNLLKTCYETAPEEIKDICLALQNRELATKTNTPTAILLYGPHGTGKSTLAQVLAQKSNPAMDCWVVHAGGLLNSYKNGSEEALRASLDPLDQIDSSNQHVVLIDEVDALTDGHDNEKDSNRAVATTIAGILDKVHGKQNMLVVLATNNLDKIPEILHSRLQYKYFKIDVPGKNQRKAAIDYWFSTLERTQFTCEDLSFSSRFLNTFRKVKSQEDNNNEFKERLAGWFWLGGASYRDIRDLFATAREIALKQAIEKKESIVTLTTQDFEAAYTRIKAKKKELELGLWGNTKKFYKDNPVLAGSITGVVGTAAVAAAGYWVHHNWEYVPQMAQSVSQHTASLAQSTIQHEESLAQAAAHHTASLAQTEFGQSTQLAGVGIAGAMAGGYGGAKAGAIIGSFFSPAGTAIGGGIGAVTGGVGGFFSPYVVHYFRK